MPVDSPEAPASPKKRVILAPRQLVDHTQLHFAPEPVLLAGTPERLHGTLLVHNPQPVDVRVRRVALLTRLPQLHLRAPGASPAAASPDGNNTDGSGKKRDSGAPMSANDADTVVQRVDALQTEAPPAPWSIDLRLAGKLGPGELLPMRAELSLPRATPPGTYSATLTGADQVERPIQIQVLAKHFTRVHPRALRLRAQPGATLSLQLSVHNQGNVRADIAAATPVLWHVADRGWTYHFHSAAKQSGSEGHTTFLDDFVQRLGQEEPPIGRARVTGGAGSLDPEALRLIDVEVAVPSDLPTGRHYLAMLPL
ncbi:MAG: hypothetical protein ACPGUV_13955, partial [Polyangiales bacterium]